MGLPEEQAKSGLPACLGLRARFPRGFQSQLPHTSLGCVLKWLLSDYPSALPMPQEATLRGVFLRYRPAAGKMKDSKILRANHTGSMYTLINYV